MVCIEPYTDSPGAPFTVGAPLQKKELEDYNNVCKTRCEAGSIRYVGRIDDNKMCLCASYAEDASPLPKGALLYDVCKKRCQTHDMVNTENQLDKGDQGLWCGCSFDKSMAAKQPPEAAITKREDCFKQEVKCDTGAYVTFFDPHKQVCGSRCAGELGKPSHIYKRKEQDHVFHIPGNHTFRCRAMSGPNIIGVVQPISHRKAFRIPINGMYNLCSEWTVTKNK